MVDKREDIRSLIQADEAKHQFALALPKHLSPDRFVRVALTSMNKNPKLLECTKASLIQSLLDCSQIGLEPDGYKAHLIPYGNQCTLIVNYKGLVEIARRSGEIADIHADVVCENDEFEYSFGSGGKLIHRPNFKSRGKVIAAYSFVKLKDGAESYEVMNLEEIEKVHQRSKAKNSGPWITDWNEMAKKTVFRRHSKWLPGATENQEVINRDFDVPIDIQAGINDKGKKPEVTMPEALSAPEPEQCQLQKAIHTIGSKVFDREDKFYEWLWKAYGREGTKDLTKSEASKAMEDLQAQLDTILKTKAKK